MKTTTEGLPSGSHIKGPQPLLTTAAKGRMCFYAQNLLQLFSFFCFFFTVNRFFVFNIESPG